MIDLDTIREAHERLAPHVVRTPTVPYYGTAFDDRVRLKMELLQRTGSFKARGALNVVAALGDDERERGVVAVSAGNHAIAASWAAQRAGVSCKVVMPAGANPFRVAQVERYGGEIVRGDTMGELFALYDGIREREGRAAVHPFEGERTFAGTAGVALELLQDAQEPLDAILVPLGGGGLISGIATAVAHLSPHTRVYGVEPEGADGMRRSLEAGAPLAKVDVASIADSLSAPLHLPLSFAVVRDHVHRIVTVSDDAMRAAMRLAFTDLKLAIEPACAASIAALAGPLAAELEGQRVALVLCGSNIDPATWWRLAEVDAPRRGG